jgi:hypothetical protein
MNKKRVVLASLIIISFILLLGSIIFFMNRLHELRQLDPLELEAMSKDDIFKRINDRQGGTPFTFSSQYSLFSE